MRPTPKCSKFYLKSGISLPHRSCGPSIPWLYWPWILFTTGDQRRKAPREWDSENTTWDVLHIQQHLFSLLFLHFVTVIITIYLIARFFEALFLQAVGFQLLLPKWVFISAHKYIAVWLANFSRAFQDSPCLLLLCSSRTCVNVINFP